MLKAMTAHAILTAIGPDRPGLVDEVSAVIFRHGGNIADSRMVNLRGQFAMMLLVGADHAALQALEAELPQLEAATHLRCQLHPAGEPADTAAAMPFRLCATALDQPGLVHRICTVLHEADVNIESMQTSLSHAPVTGSPLFEMELVLSVPRSVSLAHLRRSLDELCDRINVDYQLNAMP